MHRPQSASGNQGSRRLTLVSVTGTHRVCFVSPRRLGLYTPCLTSLRCIHADPSTSAPTDDGANGIVDLYEWVMKHAFEGDLFGTEEYWGIQKLEKESADLTARLHAEQDEFYKRLITEKLQTVKKKMQHLQIEFDGSACCKMQQSFVNHMAEFHPGVQLPPLPPLPPEFE